MPYLKWISDENLIASVHHLLTKASAAKKNTKFGRNVIDPFSAMFEIAGFEIGYDAWKESEITRQAQKALQNHIGDFHQNILGHSSDWRNKKTRNIVDLVSDKYHVLAEVKNKHNTVTKGKLADLYHSLDGQVMPKNSIYKGYTAYYVVIIPKTPKRFNIEFVPSDKEKGQRCPANDKIREIDGASFYSLVTGDDNALEELFDVLPQVIVDCSGGEYKVDEQEKVKAFFKLAFG